MGQPGEDAGGEQAGRSTVHGIRAAAADFVQGGLRQPAFRQVGIDLCYAERQRAPGTGRRALKQANALSQRVQCGGG